MGGEGRVLAFASSPPPPVVLILREIRLNSDLHSGDVTTYINYNILNFLIINF